MVSDNYDGAEKYSSIESTKVAADGSISNVNASLRNGAVQYLTVAYGDDAAGGVASMNSWTYKDNGVEVSSDYYWGEYYDGTGALLRRDNGDSRLWVPVWNEGSYTNLQALGYSAPPETYSTRSYGKSVDNAWYQYQERLTLSGEWEEISRQYSKYNSVDGFSYSITQKKNDYDVWVDAYRWYWSPSSNGGYQYWTGTSWETTNYPQGDSYSFMFKANAEVGKWTAGDSVYYWKGSSSEQVGEITYWRTDFYKGYIVPAPETRFGKEYWLSYEYPLGRVLPLASAYTDIYKLIQEEGDTDTNTWYDWENVSHDWTWTNYSYYLNKSSEGEDPINYDEGFDIRLDKLSQYDMYYWHDNKMDMVKAHFVRTTGPLPDYFTSPSTTIINTVSDKLETLMESSFNLGISDYQSRIDSAATCTDGVF